MGQASRVGYVVFAVGAGAAAALLTAWVYQRVARRRVKGGRRY
jgi:hypothetical protein